MVAFASERSAGKELEWGGGTLTVQALNDETIQGFDVILSSPGGAVSAEWSPRFAEAGATVVDNTSFWRMHEDVPLVVAGVNDEAAEHHKGIVANPNCTTMVMMMALAPIHRAVGLERFVVSSYQAVSGTGQKAIEELRAQARAILAGEDPPAPAVYPHQIAFNVIPQVETFKDGDDYTTEERKVMAETRKILGVGEEVGISATCARVPVFVGHGESINLQTKEDLSPDDCRALLSEADRRQGRRRPRRGGLPDLDRLGGPGRRPRRPHPPRPEPASAPSTSGPPATTSARAPPPTPSRSPRSWSSAAGS